MQTIREYEWRRVLNRDIVATKRDKQEGIAGFMLGSILLIQLFMI